MPIELLHLTRRFTSAIDYARHLHIERRKGTDIPYMAHLLGVSSLVMGEAGHVDFAVTEDMAIAALLHDAAEDHGGILRLDDIESNFGPNVARIVGGLTDSFAEDSHAKEPWLERKSAYLDRLRKEPPDVQLISAADKLHNARAILEDYREIGGKVWERFKRGREDQIWYFEELLDIYRLSGRNRIVAELSRVIAELKRLSEVESAESTVPIPNFQTLLLPVLKVLEDGAEHDVEEIRQRIANQFAVTASELAQKNKAGISVFVNLVAWALSHLNRGHTTAITLVRTGVYKITEHGAAILKRNPTELAIRDL